MEQALKSPKNIGSNAVLHCDDGGDKEVDGENTTVGDVQTLREELKQKESSIVSMKVLMHNMRRQRNITSRCTWGNWRLRYLHLD